MLQISVLGSIEGLMYYLFNENIGVDQLRGYHTADLPFCFLHMQKSRFSHDAVSSNLLEKEISKLNVIQSAYCVSRAVRKPAFCICENKDADQLRSNREADQRLCFRYIDSTIPLLSKSEISSL